jgi:hypothetical protein
LRGIVLIVMKRDRQGDEEGDAEHAAQRARTAQQQQEQQQPYEERKDEHNKWLAHSFAHEQEAERNGSDVELLRALRAALNVLWAAGFQAREAARRAQQDSSHLWEWALYVWKAHNSLDRIVPVAMLMGFPWMLKMLLERSALSIHNVKDRQGCSDTLLRFCQDDMERAFLRFCCAIASVGC